MSCRERTHVFKVLTGDLSPSKSTAMLEHFRRCGECREAFEFAAKTITRTGAVGGFADAQSHGDADTPAPAMAGGRGRRRRCDATAAR